MFVENLFIIVGAGLFVFLLWIIVGVRHLKYLHKELEAQWELVWESLMKRYDLIPNLMETARRFTDKEEVLIEEVIDKRKLACGEKSKGGEKILLEIELSKGINELVGLGVKYPLLAIDTNFLELRKEIDDLENNLEEKTNRYNDMVRYYNRHRNILILRPLALVFRYHLESIFEVEK